MGEKEQRQFVKQREKRKCFFCESKKDLTYAHIFVWVKDGGSSRKENGVCICRECHDKMDFGKGVSKQEQIRMLRQCQSYLVFLYCSYEKQREIPEYILRKGKKK